MKIKRTSRKTGRKPVRRRKSKSGRGFRNKLKTNRKSKKSVKRGNKKKKMGKGLINSMINKLPFELHIPTYQYCGPGTKLRKRLKRGDPGINELDRACKEHDIAYALTNDIGQRNRADNTLAKTAWSRVKSKDASFGEKAAALGITGIMKTKSKLGMGMREKRTGGCIKKRMNKNKKKPSQKSTTTQIFRKAVKSAKSEIQNKHPQTIPDAAKLAIEAAKVAVKNHKISKSALSNSLPRIIPVPKIGGVLPLIPIFAGLSALGALMGGSAGVANAVVSANKAKKDFNEAKRHNQSMEAIALGKKNLKTGNGLYLMPYKKGLGLFLSPYSKNV